MVSKLFSVGVAQATSTAKITVGDDVVIRGLGAVNLTSDASATASMSTATAREMGAVGGSNKTQVALSLAISNADVTSKTTVAETARIRAGTTLNVRALGEHESGAEAESGLFSNGLAGLALALQFSKEDVLAEVNGTLQADMTHPDGAVVKLEFDPGKIVDYALDTIDAGTNWVVVTEDTVTYQPRRGTLINGLTPGADYFIIHLVDDADTTAVDEGSRVRLATTEQKAIDGAKWEEANPHSVRDGVRNPYAVDLTPGGGALNRQSFSQADVTRPPTPSPSAPASGRSSSASRSTPSANTGRPTRSSSPTTAPISSTRTATSSTPPARPARLRSPTCRRSPG